MKNFTQQTALNILFIAAFILLIATVIAAIIIVKDGKETLLYPTSSND